MAVETSSCVNFCVKRNVDRVRSMGLRSFRYKWKSFRCTYKLEQTEVSSMQAAFYTGTMVLILLLL